MPASPPDPLPEPDGWGLCASCAHHLAITSDRGTRFVQCVRSRTDPRYARYPVVPVRRCDGFTVRRPGENGRDGNRIESDLPFATDDLE